MTHRIGVYPGTFDPISLGHEDIVLRAAAMFDKVILAVATAHHKKTLFTLDERMDMAREAMQMRKYFRSLNPEYQRLALELVKTLVKAQGKAS